MTFNRFLSCCMTWITLAQHMPAVAAPPADLRAIDHIVQESMQMWQVPGVALAVVRDGKILILKGYGHCDLTRRDAVTPDTVFPLASCTKAFTSAALAGLVDDGKVAWDDPVRKHLPDFHLADPHADGLVTVRDLLCHRTGVNGHDFLWYRAPWNADESIRRLRYLKASGQFRSSYHYQSIMYMAAGRIVDRHDATRWQGAVQRRFLEPLGMTRTFLSDENLPPPLAQPHRRINGKAEAMSRYPLPSPNAAGSIHTTARDLSKWLLFHLGDGTFNGRRLLSRENMNVLHTPQAIIPNEGFVRAVSPESVQVSYAMGWIVQDHRGLKLLQHGGMIDGFRTHLSLLPDHGLGIAIMNNLHDTRMNLVVSNRLIDLLIGLPEKDWTAIIGDVVKAEEQQRESLIQRRTAERKSERPPTLSLDRYTGRFLDPAYGTCDIVSSENRLTARWSSFALPLNHAGGDTFTSKSDWLTDVECKFTIEGGRVRSVRLRAIELDVEFVSRPAE